MTTPVTITPYDERWPGLFEREARVLCELFSDVDCRIEHVGSTAVPGLGAKAIIDVLFGVEQIGDVESRIARLERAGYEYVPAYEVQLPERRYFRKRDRSLHTYHIHAVVKETRFWVDHLLFRDYLRNHPNQVRRYGELKRLLAQRYGRNRVGYTAAKSDFIAGALSRARAELLVSPHG